MRWGKPGNLDAEPPETPTPSSSARRYPERAGADAGVEREDPADRRHADDLRDPLPQERDPRDCLPGGDPVRQRGERPPLFSRKCSF